jgi:hypothetical protein
MWGMKLFYNDQKRDEVTGGWRKLHNEELSDLYPLPNILRVVKSRTMRWAGLVASMGEVCTRFWWGNLRERDHWGDPDVDGSIILRWIFRVLGTGWSWLRIGRGAGTWEYGNEFSGSIKCGEFLD